MPYVGAEALYDTRYDAWSQQRYEVGVEIVLDDHWRLEPHYLRQDDVRQELCCASGKACSDDDSEEPLICLAQGICGCSTDDDCSEGSCEQGECED